MYLHELIIEVVVLIQHDFSIIKLFFTFLLYWIYS